MYAHGLLNIQFLIFFLCLLSTLAIFCLLVDSWLTDSHSHHLSLFSALAMFLGWLLMSAVGAMLQVMYTAQEIDTDLFIRSCGCGSRVMPDDKGVRYVVLPQPKLKALLLHQTNRGEMMKDSWDNITG